MQLKKENLSLALEQICQGAELYVPAVVGDVAQFVRWQQGMTPAMDAVNTKLPPKDVLFPHKECMYTYTTGKEQQLAETVDDTRRILFGVRPCDVRSIGCMDKVFLGDAYTDSYYRRRRENVTIIASACTRQVADTCFCQSMGGDPAMAEGADVLLSDTGEAYTVTAQSEKGEAVLKLWKDILDKGGKNAAGVENTLKCAMSDELSQKLTARFDDAIWAENSRPCIGCGTCTYLCPTCYCFDIGSENHGVEGAEFRCWDSCMFSDYTRMAGGHDPRPSKKERLRNRYLHKLAYFRERYGQVLCVGCGRCVEHCPGHLDITAFIDRAAERFGDGG